MQLSARNQIPARVTSVNSGEAIANVELPAGRVRVVTSITVRAVRELGLAEGSNVTSVIKASDVILGAGDGRGAGARRAACRASSQAVPGTVHQAWDSGRSARGSRRLRARWRGRRARVRDLPLR